MQLVDEALRKHYVVLHAVKLVSDLPLLVLVEIDRIVIVLELLRLLLKSRYCVGLVNHDQSLHFQLFWHTLGLLLLIIKIHLEHQRLREEVEAIEHKQLYLPKKVIEKVHV